MKKGLAIKWLHDGGPFVHLEKPIDGVCATYTVADDGTITWDDTRAVRHVVDPETAVQTITAGGSVDTVETTVPVGERLLALPPTNRRHPEIRPGRVVAFMCEHCQGGVPLEDRVVQTDDVIAAAARARDWLRAEGKAVKGANWHALNRGAVCPVCGNRVKAVRADDLVDAEIRSLRDEVSGRDLTAPLTLPEIFGAFTPDRVSQPKLRPEWAGLLNHLPKGMVVAHYAQCAKKRVVPDRWYICLPRLSAGIVTDSVIESGFDQGWSSVFVDKFHEDAPVEPDWDSFEAKLGEAWK